LKARVPLLLATKSTARKIQIVTNLVTKDISIINDKRPNLFC